MQLGPTVDPFRPSSTCSAPNSAASQSGDANRTANDLSGHALLLQPMVSRTRPSGLALAVVRFRSLAAWGNDLAYVLQTIRTDAGTAHSALLERLSYEADEVHKSTPLSPSMVCNPAEMPR